MHWNEVGVLIKRAAQDAGFNAELVSQSDDVGVMQKRIVQNLYECPVVVCDISGRNANVMFELGMRLAFDKPTIVVKDDKTPFSFDTSPLEHLTYPRDLRYSKVEPFVEELTSKLKASTESDGQDSFLKSFGSFKVADISLEKAPLDELILEEISSLKNEVRHIRDASRRFGILTPSGSGHRRVINVEEYLQHSSIGKIHEIGTRIEQLKAVTSVDLRLKTSSGQSEMYIHFDSDAPLQYVDHQMNRVEELLATALV